MAVSPRPTRVDGFRAGRTNSCFASFTHSGHWWPTAAGSMQSVQIGRPHRVQCTPVSTLGWR